MLWGEADDEAQGPKGQENAIPPTPAPAAWALRAIPTLFFGTPKLRQQNDKVFADITNELEHGTNSRIAPKSQKDNPETPLRVGNDARTGILKTPGTAGPAKNVSFAAHRFEDSSLVDVSMSSPSIGRQGTQKKIDRIRSGLPHNFPGKFPSPWTPKVAHYEEDEYEDRGDAKEIQRPEIPLPVNGMPDQYLEEMNKVLVQLEENNRNLETKLRQHAESTTQNTANNKLIADLRHKIEQAVEYAKLRDQEASEQEFKLAEATEKHNRDLEEYEQRIQSLMDTPKGSSVDVNLNKELKAAKSTEQRLRKTLADTEKERDRTFNDLERVLNSANSLTTERDELRQELDKLKSQSESGHKESPDTGVLRQELEDIKRDHGKLARVNDELEVENGRLEAEVRRLKDGGNRVDQLQAENKRLQSEIDTLRKEQNQSAFSPDMDSRVTQLREDRDNLSLANNRLESELRQAQLATEKLREENKRLLNDLESSFYKQEMTRLQDKLERQRQQFEKEFEEQRSTLETRAASRQKEYESRNSSLQQELDNLRQEVSTLRRTVSAKREDLEEHAKLLRDQLEKKDRELATVRQSQSSHNVQLAELRNKRDQAEQRASDLQREVERLSRQVKALTGSGSNRTSTAFARPSSSMSNASSIPQRETENLISLDDMGPPPSVPSSGLSGPRLAPLAQSFLQLQGGSPMKDAGDTDNSRMSFSSTRSDGSILGDPERENASRRRLQERRARNLTSSPMSVASQ
uniref:ARAD1D15554p n=1 Tax=Blastobotrys adeninivorans TaxID=409370 RepID=A0A060TFI0_BLAAD